VTRLLSAVAILLATAALSSAQSQDDLKKKREEALKEPFLKKAPWLLDYDKALAEAKKTGKPVFAYFTRSYAP
jgi:hypothetical protein